MSEQPIAMLDGFPRLTVALLPTPLRELVRLRAFLGLDCPRLLVKRDDLTGLALGGNKARKLEYLLGDAEARNASTVITCGAAQSNHALQTAAACREFGFEVRCVLYGADPDPNAPKTGNLLLHDLLDTPIRWVRMRNGETRTEQALRRGMAEEALAVQSEGKSPYCVPTGGSTAIGALGYVRAIQELRAQLDNGGADGVGALYFASGSGGTQAGMVVGARVADWQVRCIGVEIDPIPRAPNGVSPFQRAVLKITEETGDLLNIEGSFSLGDIELDAGFAGPAYGTETQEGHEAARLLFRTEGILLDPVYTAKAFAALLSAVRERRFAVEDTVIFWHTGGAAGLFSGH